MRHFFILLFLFTLMFGSCTSKGYRDLSDALTTAVKDQKLSVKKKQIILDEYELLRKEDPQKARKYVEQIVKAIEMGADSSHIDVMRRQVRKLEIRN